VEENVAEELVQLVNFEEETSENDHVEENVVEELAQLVDFGEG
jgi:hypothetical protein